MTSPGVIREKAREILMKLLERKLQGAGKRVVIYNDFFPIDPELVITDVLGWRLRKLKDYDKRATSDFSKEIIYLNLTGTNPGEAAFSLAHELGHAVLHGRAVECLGGRADRPPRSVRRGVRQPMPSIVSSLESDANRFAAELLMPRKPVSEHFRNLFGVESLKSGSTEAMLLTKVGAGASVYQVARALADYKVSTNMKSLAEQFGTSSDAMARRLAELDLVIQH